VRFAVDLDRILAPAIQHRAAAVGFEATASSQIGAGLGLTWRRLCELRLAAMTRDATAAARLRSLAAATFEDAAAAVGYRSALPTVASLFAVVAVARVDGLATAVAGVDLVAAA